MADRTKSKILRFAVSGMLVSAPLVTACGGDEPTANEPQPTINEVADPEPEVEETINEPEPEPVVEPTPNEMAPPAEEAPTPTEGE